MTETEGGYLLHKFPRELIPKLSKKGQPNAYTLHGSELRFVLLGLTEITFTSTQSAQILIYYGDYQGEFYSFTGEITIQLSPKFDTEGLYRLSKKHRFEPNLVRILLKENLILKKINGAYTYPDTSKFPNKHYLCYGTSISQGRNGLTPDMNYPSIFSERLGYDLLNYSMSGSAYIEQALVDFMLDKTYDLITLELSINLLGDGYGVDVFEERLGYLLEQISIKQPKAQVIGITILDNWRKLGFDQNRGTQKDVIEFREAFKRVARNYRQVTLMDGALALEFHHLSVDLIHPSQYGMIELANRIYQHIKM